MDVRFLDSIQHCPPEQWDQLFNTDYPFIKHAFLHALEISGCTNASTGWTPQHCLVFHEDKMLAALPLYLKTHSYGEYVFDWAWANAYQQHGLSYYPKLLSAVPFTPSTGPRVAFHSDIHADDEQLHILRTIDQAIGDKFRPRGISSWHLLFPEKRLSTQLDTCNWKQRVGIQYHWFNKHYTSFAGFLGTLKSRKRKNINKERAAVEKQGVSLRTISGTEINHELIEKFYAFYQKTYIKRSGQQGYLNLNFFQLLQKNMPENLVMFCAEKNATLIAAALCFKDKANLYGRYWGCEKEYEFLHFETCYYQGIEYCINNKLQHFDPGAQGEHKIPRGFEPIITYSNHVILHTEFCRAIENFIDDEKDQVNAHIKYLNTLLPFKSEIP
ncbi:MAG: GNAT family N-acetyltransferase [Piscirickettsiaceae bacterium]|nr:MAG: GNAT family N-acetyltransferase [Piscirickettsiaceae bacterium]